MQNHEVSRIPPGHTSPLRQVCNRARTVTFRCRKPGQSERPRYGTITVSAEEFIRRFLLDVVPDGMHRIRHFGILTNALAEHGTSTSHARR